MEKEEKKQKKILTDNHMVTVNKRETSFEGLVSQFENGEDGIYNLITNNKQIIFQPKVTITKQDLADIPMLRQLRESIDAWEGYLQRVEGRERFVVKSALIEMRRDQYLIKNAYRKPITFNKITHTSFNMPLLEDVYEWEDGFPIPEGVNLMNPKVCEAILVNYSRLKEDSWSRLDSDTWCLVYDFERTCDKALEKYPLYMRIVECKIDGMQNKDIQFTIQMEFGIKHSVEYISSLWRKKIPKLIASAAEDDFLQWYYLNKSRGKYKRCSRSGQIKLAHNKYFSKNNTSKDGYYSICKECRNKKQPIIKIKVDKINGTETLE